MKKIIRKDKSFFDLVKELDFLNVQLNQGYLLTSTSINAYEFEETSLKGQYYIAYITDEKQKQELDEMADEITEIENADFHSVQRILRRTKNAIYQTDKLNGTWCYYFSPNDFDCLEDDIKRKNDMYLQFMIMKGVYTLISIALVVFFPIFIMNNTDVTFTQIFMPWQLIEIFLKKENYIFAFVMIAGLVYEYIFPFYFVFSLYQITRLYKNKRSCS